MTFYVTLKEGRVKSLRLLGSKLGKGAFGRVNKVYHLTKHKMEALKVSLRASREGIWTFSNETGVLRELQEKSTHIPGLQKRPHRAKYIHSLAKKSLHEGYFAPLYVSDLLKSVKKGELTTKQRVQATLRLMNALRYCHGKGVTIGDIKLENILVDSDGQSDFADFGSARSESNLFASSAFVHTKASSDKETAEKLKIQIKRDKDPEVTASLLKAHDVFCLGLNLYRMFAQADLCTAYDLSTGGEYPDLSTRNIDLSTTRFNEEHQALFSEMITKMTNPLSYRASMETVCTEYIPQLQSLLLESYLDGEAKRSVSPNPLDSSKTTLSSDTSSEEESQEGTKNQLGGVVLPEADSADGFDKSGFSNPDGSDGGWEF
jgi:serine/threonine protein kinase